MNHFIDDDNGNRPGSPYHKEPRVIETKEECTCCGELAELHRPLAFKNGQVAYPKFCDLCLEEFESGRNPLFKPSREVITDEHRELFNLNKSK